MPNTLPNEPLQITITEAAREVFALRAAVAVLMQAGGFLYTCADTLRTTAPTITEQRAMQQMQAAIALGKAVLDAAPADDTDAEAGDDWAETEWEETAEPNPFACDCCGSEPCLCDREPNLAERLASDMSADRFGL